MICFLWFVIRKYCLIKWKKQHFDYVACLPHENLQWNLIKRKANGNRYSIDRQICSSCHDFHIKYTFFFCYCYIQINEMNIAFISSGFDDE